MKRIASIVSVAVITACLVVIFWLSNPASAGSRLADSQFKVNDERTVHFHFAPETVEELSDVEREDQLRDWLLYAVMGQSGLDSAGLRNAMYDLPPSRAGYLKPVGAFQYGEVRYRVIDSSGTTVAMIPAGSPRRNEFLAQVADAARINVGAEPHAVRVFEYDLNTAELTATVKRMPDVSGDQLFSPAFGYVEGDAESIEALAGLMGRIDDLTSASASPNGIHLTGRQINGAKARKMRVEDIAALWQSDSQLAADRNQIEAFDAKWKDESYLESKITQAYSASRDQFLTRRPDLVSQVPENWDQVSSTASADGTETSPASTFLANWSNKDLIHKALQQEHDSELSELEKSLASKGSKGIPNGSGFSLDPSFDYRRLAGLFNALKPELSLVASPEEVAEAGQHVSNRDETPFLDLLYKMEHSDNQLVASFGRASGREIQDTQFQHARYDGNLAGTEDGMVLFYTDLMAKLWALDYLEKAPAQQVRGFVPLLKVQTSPIYEKEVTELSGTRLWFGPRDNSYSKTSQELLFAPVATRVYAASSNTLRPGKEAEANADSAKFLGWWNDHYAQVAQYEPQYERLNQIMKWSVVVGWLSSTSNSNHLQYLNGVNVKRDNWFPLWARQNHDLKFRNWEGVEFYQRGYLGVDTESMPILASRWYGPVGARHALSGGVSLGSREDLLRKPELKMDIEAAARRANVEMESAAEGQTIKSSDNMVFKLKTIESGKPAEFELSAKAGAKLRGEDVELKNASFSSTIQQTDYRLTVSIAADNHNVGTLSTEYSGRNVDLLFAPRDLEYSRVFTRTISKAASRGDSVLDALAGRPDVRTVLENNGVYYVEPWQNRSNWIRISPEGEARADIASSADLRFGEPGTAAGDPASRWNVHFVDRKTVETELGHSGFVVQPPATGTREGVAFSVNGRGPPPDGGKVVVALSSGDENEPGVLARLENARSQDHGGPNGPNGPKGPNGPNGPGGGGDGPGILGFGGDDGARKLAHEAAANPDHFLLYMSAERRKAVYHSDKLLKAGKFEEARIELDKVAVVFPDDPEVLMKRAIAHAGSDSYNTAAEASRLNLSKAQLPEFLDTADAALPHLPPDSSARARLEAVVRGTVAKADGRDVHYFAKEDGVIGVEIRLSSFRREAMGANETAPGGAQYTLESLDTPVVGVSQPTPPLSEPITGKIRDETLALTAPDRIVDKSTGKRYARASGRPSPDSSYSFRVHYQASPDNCSDDHKRRSQPGCSDTIYLADQDRSKVASL